MFCYLALLLFALVEDAVIQEALMAPARWAAVR